MPIAQMGVKAPNIKETAFNCPHCKALAKQFWYSAHSQRIADNGTPTSFSDQEAEEFGDGVENSDVRESLVAWAKRLASGQPFFNDKHHDPYTFAVYNVSFSKCYNCDDVAVWIGSRLVYPMIGNVLPPNIDLPDDIKRDYLEAADIVDLSPRGSAALLRLAIQKLCIYLGGDGNNINNDIAVLVKGGLDKRVQQALDIVRVIGNNAVHPGELNMTDDRVTAERLFGLLNLIAESMLSQPKHVASMYEALPEGARQAVERRDSN